MHRSILRARVTKVTEQVGSHMRSRNKCMPRMISENDTNRICPSFMISSGGVASLSGNSVGRPTALRGRGGEAGGAGALGSAGSLTPGKLRSARRAAKTPTEPFSMRSTASHLCACHTGREEGKDEDGGGDDVCCMRFCVYVLLLCAMCPAPYSSAAFVTIPRGNLLSRVM